MLYGNFIWWVGVVEDRDDPMKIGRYRVRIQGYHTADSSILPTEDLPWAMTVQPVGSAAVSGIGHDGTGLVTGSTVVGFFSDGENEQMPIIMGSLGGVDTILPKSNSGFSDPNGVYPKKDLIDESSLSRLARGGEVAELHPSLAIRRDLKVSGIPKARPSEFEGINDPLPTVSNTSSVDVKDDGGETVPAWDEPFAQGSENSKSQYPYNKVMETESGHVQEFDDTPGAERIHTYHKSGSNEEYQPNGDHVQKIVGDDFEIVYNNKTLYVQGDVNIAVKGDVNMKVDGNKIEDIGGNLYQTIRGGRFVKVQGTDALEVISDQKISVDGSRYTVIGCMTAQPPITIPFIGGIVPAGKDHLTVKGGMATQVGGRKNETIGGKYALSAVGGLKFFSSLGSMEVITLRDINMSAGTLGAFSATGGQINLAATLNMNIDTGGILTMTTIGAMAVSSAAATYTHAATIFNTAAYSVNAVGILTLGTAAATTQVDINATAITLN
jgi:hypothetical protein